MSTKEPEQAPSQQVQKLGHPKVEPTPQQTREHADRLATKVRQSDLAQDQRLTDAQKALGVPGPKRGGLAEALASPEAFQKSKEMREQKEAQRTQAKTDLGIRTPARPAQTAENLVNFADGAATPEVARPRTISNNPRFIKKD